ncbi:hypothetical protein RP20_CCG003572 [Aedes albopictus]|nr:hypothetical protein RP20_CCG003572 [Aedes albopictus]
MEFPTEVLDQVLTYLTLRDRKSMSLVCQSWSEIAFSSLSLKSVMLYINSTWDQSIVDCFRNSTRRYKNVMIFLKAMNFDWIIEILDLFGGGLESFESLTRFTEEQMWNVIIRVPNIRKLIVFVDASFLKYDRSIPVSRCLHSSSNVLPELLQLDTNPTTSQYAIKLVEVPRAYELPSEAYYFSVEELRFPKLQVLKLTNWDIVTENDKALRLFFNGVPSLKDVKLRFFVNNRLLDVLTQTCSGIENLDFQIEYPNSETFQLLERLKKIKNLRIHAYKYFKMSLKGKPLFSVKRFCFNLVMEDYEAKMFQGFRQLLPNVEDLVIKLERNFSPFYACQCFSQLKRLTVADESSRRHMFSADFFRNFGNLGQLEELTLDSIYVQLECMPPIRHLKRLKLKLYIWFTDEDIPRLAELYPELRYLELFWCAEVPPRGVEEFRSRLPDCVVECIDCV